MQLVSAIFLCCQPEQNCSEWGPFPLISYLCSPKKLYWDTTSTKPSATEPSHCRPSLQGVVQTPLSCLILVNPLLIVMNRNELRMQGREAMLVPETLSSRDISFYFAVIQTSLHLHTSLPSEQATLPSACCQDGLEDTFPAYNGHSKFFLLLSPSKSGFL